MREQRSDNGEFHRGAKNLAGRDGNHRLRTTADIPAHVRKAGRIAGRSAEAGQVSQQCATHRCVPESKKYEDTGEAHAKSHHTLRRWTFFGKNGHGYNEGQQRSGRVPYAGSDGRDSCLAIGEETERHDVHQKGRRREVDPESPAAWQGFTPYGQYEEQRGRPEEYARQCHLERGQRLIADFDEQEAEAPDRRQQSELCLPADPHLIRTRAHAFFHSCTEASRCMRRAVKARRQLPPAEPAPHRASPTALGFLEHIRL